MTEVESPSGSAVGSIVPAVVTGAGGFLGRHLVVALLASGRPVTALTRHRPLGFTHPLLHEVEGDVAAPGGLAVGIARGATVFHLAAERPAVTARRQDLRRTNLEGTRQMGALALAAGVGRFVHLSTAWTHGAATDGRRRDESDPAEATARADAYVASRLDAREAVAELVAVGLPAVIASPTVVFGPERPGSRNRVTREMARLLRRRIVVLVAGGRQRRTLAFVDDVVDGLLRVEARGRTGEEYVLGGEDVGHRDLALRTLAAGGATPRLVVSLPAPLLRLAAGAADRLRRHDRGSGWRARVDTLTAEWRFDSRRAERELGYRVTPLDRALARTVAALDTTGGRT